MKAGQRQNGRKLEAFKVLEKAIIDAEINSLITNHQKHQCLDFSDDIVIIVGTESDRDCKFQKIGLKIN